MVIRGKLTFTGSLYQYKLMRHLILLLFIASFCSVNYAQNLLPIGAWRTHQPKRQGSFVTQSEREIYYASPTSVMVLDKEELSPRYITRIDGLSNTNIRLLQYHQASELLVIVYEDGVIDLYHEDKGVTTVNAIKNFNNITGEKLINDVFIHDQFMLLAGSYGVSAFLLENASIPFTTFMGQANVKSVAVHNNKIYAGTEEGIYRTDLNNNTIEDFITWEFLDENFGLPSDYSARAMEVYKGDLYLTANEDVYKVEDNQAVLFSDQDPALSAQYMSAEGDYLLVGYRCTDSDVCSRGRIVYFDGAAESGELGEDCLGVTNYAVEDQFGRFWFGDDWSSYRYVTDKSDTYCSKISFNGPYNEDVWRMEILDNELWVATGAITPTRTPLFVDTGMASFKDGEWVVYNRNTHDGFKGFNPDPNVRDDDVFTLIDVAKNTNNGKVYGASFITGLIEIVGEDVNIYDQTNSPLSGPQGDEDRTRVSGLAVDDEGNLWVSNYAATEGKSLHRLAPDGTWVSFDDDCGQNKFFQIVIDNSGYKWVMIGGSSAGVMVFDEGDINNLNDDRCRVFTSSNSNLPSNETNCLAVDQDGDVWVGTNAGIVIFECGASAFDDVCQGSLRIVELDGFLEHLFKTQAVQSIAVDGANRKWVGTTNGAYLISPDGKETILHFTKENSPLLDNFVRTIAINEQTGEVFFGTDAGIISYQGDAIEGKRVNNAEPKVFPNPVRPDYQGTIAVRGLAENANVKITDVNGKLVYETEALGGQAIWDGRDYNGRRVQTGVYLVFSTTNPRNVGLGKPDAAVAKILFIN